MEAVVIDPGRLSGPEMDREALSRALRGGEPDRVSGQPQLLREERGQLPAERMDDKARVARSQMAGDFRVFFLVADDRAQGGQAAGDPVDTGGNALTERERRERLHRTGTLADFAGRWQVGGQPAPAIPPESVGRGPTGFEVVKNIASRRTLTERVRS